MSASRNCWDYSFFKNMRHSWSWWLRALAAFYLQGVLLIYTFAKTIVGEHRPHFFDTCMPDTNTNCTLGTYVFDFKCTNSDKTAVQLTDSSRSFPSGHSSLSWFTTLYCIYIIHSRLPIHRTGTALKILLFGVCALFGLTSSLTRITDRRHHWWDVAVGTLIGILGSAYVIRTTHVQVKILHRKLVSDDFKDGKIDNECCDV